MSIFQGKPGNVKNLLGCYNYPRHRAPHGVPHRAYWPGVAIRGNLTYHITVHFRVFLEKPRFCYRNGHHKQYILVDTIFNYRFHFGLPGKCLYLSPQNRPFWRRWSRRQKGVFSALFYRHVPGSPK